MIRGLQKLQKSKYNLNLRYYIMCVCDDFAKTNSRCETRVIIIFAQVLMVVVETAQKAVRNNWINHPFSNSLNTTKIVSETGMNMKSFRLITLCHRGFFVKFIALQSLP